MSSNSPKPKNGVLLMNLGTPDNTKISSIRRYLREFLLDPRVIDLPCWLRYLIVYGAILPFRAFKTAKAYQQIWQNEGSPLRIHTQNLAKKVSTLLGNDYQVETAMRYGTPAISTALTKLSHCSTITVLPLFPQYSSAATGSAIAKTLTELSKQANIPHIRVISQFYDQETFIRPLANLIKPYLVDPDTFLLLSYHGLPERHIDKSGCHANCDRKLACPPTTINNAFCYRAQCYQTSRRLSAALSLTDNRCTTSFQSRLGRTPWIKPYTDEILVDLYTKGIRKLVIACPAFTADCLETLEEIGMQAKQQWLALGGEAFDLVPCLNDNSEWAESVALMIQSTR